MTKFNCNIIVAILAGIIIILVLLYLGRGDRQTIVTEGFKNGAYLPKMAPQTSYKRRNGSKYLPSVSASPTLPDGSDLSDEVVSLSRRPDKSSSKFRVSASDPHSDQYGKFDSYETKKHIDMKKMDDPFNEENMGDDARDFVYKKKLYTHRTIDDIKDQFDVDKMLPQEIEDDWFDVEPLMSTKKIKGTHLINPKVHIGVNTVQSSLRNGTHDIRGDIPNPKINISPWNNSTIEPDNNIRGLC